jgi:hypothetical protein
VDLLEKGALGGNITVRVKIGDRDITDMVKVEIDNHNDSLTKALSYGRVT